jgi:hypothetical protein
MGGVRGVSEAEITGDVRVSRSFERAKPVTDDEDADTEATKGSTNNGGNREQCPEAVQEQTPNEDGAVAKVS